MNLLLDTNILLDVLAKREPFYNDSASIWAHVEAGHAEGYVSAISFNNVYYIVRRFANRPKAIRAVDTLNKLFQIAPVNARVIQKAISCPIKDFEGAIQWASASETGIDRIITRNTQDFPTDLPVALSPMEFLSTLDF